MMIHPPPFSAHCAAIGFPLRSVRWSWAARSLDGSKILFTVWQDEVSDGVYILYPVTERRPGKIPETANTQLGAREALRLAEEALGDSQISVFGILCVADNTDGLKRKRKTFDRYNLLRLRLSRDARGYLLATIGEQVTVEKFVKP